MSNNTHWSQEDVDKAEGRLAQGRMNKVSADLKQGKMSKKVEELVFGSSPAKKIVKKRQVAKQIIAMCEELKKKGIAYTTELKFHPLRKWRFDIAIGPVNGKRIAIEFHGGQWTSGGHLRGGNFQNDLDKSNAAQSMGWVVLAFTTQHFSKDGIGAYGVVQMVKQILNI